MTAIRWYATKTNAWCGATYIARACGEPVAWCRQWQAPTMSAPSFWYFCDEHGRAQAARDGVELQAPVQ